MEHLAHGKWPNIRQISRKGTNHTKSPKKSLKKEIDRLVKIGILKKVNHSQWGVTCFVITKKDQTIRFINDFRELNKRIKRNPFPLPSIQDMLLKLEGFQYATSLDLNMGYYHSNLCFFYTLIQMVLTVLKIDKNFYD